METVLELTDATSKQLKLASLVSPVVREHGIELVVVGGSAIEFYTDGASLFRSRHSSVLTM